MIDYSTLSAVLIESIDAWVEEGRPTGHFLMAIITNDLQEAFARADEHSIATMHSIVGYFYNKTPSSCWGSPEKAKAWLDAGGLAGLRKQLELEALQESPQ